MPLTSALSKNHLLIAGGVDTNNTAQNQVLVFNIQTRKEEKTTKSDLTFLASSQGVQTTDGSAVGLV